MLASRRSPPFMQPIQEVDRVPDTTNIYDGIQDLDTIGGRLSRSREAAGLTVKQLAWRLGVKVATINAWESDRSQPGANRMNMLAGLLGVSLSWLLHGIGSAPIERDEDAGAEAEVTAEALTGQMDKLLALHSETGQLIDRLQSDLARIDARR
jgi:transcriptional regulator with XRE-family HTH domain